jgi:Arc/MetJ-type ribon-helix-helix transcriptional regulator
MNIRFTEKQHRFKHQQVESGDFQNSSEVGCDALRLHETCRHKIIEDLKAEKKGWAGASSKRTVQDIIQDILLNPEIGRVRNEINPGY